MSELKTILVVPDTHAPYHDQRAWELMMTVARDIKPNGIVCIGDLADFYSVSSHSKDPNRALRLDEELHVVGALLDELDSLKAERKIFIGGNHEDRLERYLRNVAPELYNLVSIPQVLKLEERAWEYVPYKESIQVGKVYFTHDVGTAGKYSVYRVMDAFQHSVVTGHTHRFMYLVEGDATGSRQVSVQFGWLGDVEQMDYMHKVKARRDWSLGFGIGYLDTDTEAIHFVPVPLVGYQCVVNGILYG